MSKCIVTGATGFIGTALCRELMAEGDEVYAVVRSGSGKTGKLVTMKEEAPSYGIRLHIIEAGLGELEKRLSEDTVRADVFYHLAWNGSGGKARDDFEQQYSNIGYIADALRAAKSCDCRKFVGAGSQAEYGVVHGKTREDETVPRPFMMYGAAKLSAFHMGRVLGEQLGISFVWPRIYSVYGVGENAGTLIRYLMETLKKGEQPELSPCENLWNFLYITDCARMLAILGKSEKTEGIYHVASGDTRRLRDFIEELRDIVAPEIPLGFGKRASDPSRTFWLEPDIAKVEAITHSEYVPFSEGVRKMAMEKTVL